MKGKIYTKEFKSKIVLETLKGEMTLAQICSKFGTSPRSVKDWRRRAIKGLSSLFEAGKTTKPDFGDAFEECMQLEGTHPGSPLKRAWSRIYSDKRFVEQHTRV